MKDYDESTAFLGQWGCFQQVVFFVLVASIIPNGSGVFSVVFLLDIPRHYCLIPKSNLTEDWLNAVIPMEVTDGEEERSSCSRYRLDVVKNLSSLGLIPGRDVNLTQLEKESCVDGWNYSKDIYQSTIVSEFDLVCSEQWKQPFTSTVNFLGVLTGSFISGQLSDRFGRKPVLFATMMVQTIFTFVQIFSPSWESLCVLLFIAGMGQISNYVSGFVLGAEILTGNVRVVFTSLGICLGYSVGYMMLPLFAYYLRNWKSLLLALSLPGLAYFPLWWLIPESPRWLLSQGRVEEAEAIIRKAARWNKVEAPQVIFDKSSSLADEVKTQPTEHHNVFSLLRTSNIRNTTVILCLVWFTLSTGYFGLSLNTSRLHADVYLSCFISAAIEVPAYISCWLALRYIPRRVSIICVLLLGGVSLFLIQLTPKSLPSLSVALEMLGKFGITSGASLIYSYTAELYPTVLRNTATGTCSTVSKVGSSIAPFLLQLSVYSRYLPYIILGTLSVVSAFAALFLPESFRRPLPETIQQMQKRKRPHIDNLVKKLKLKLGFFFQHNSCFSLELINGEMERSTCSRYKLGVVKNLYQSTIVSEFDLVCSEQWKQPFTSTIFFIGVVFGSFFSGQIADSWLALLYLPRRVCVISSFLIEAVSLFLIQLVPKSLHTLSLALEMLGKYAVTTVSSLMFTYIAELYPTVLRNTATGTCSTVSRMGSCMATLLLELGGYFKYLPYIIMGTLAAVSAFATLFLPESFGKPLPETIQQMHPRERLKCSCIPGQEPPKTSVLLDSPI